MRKNTEYVCRGIDFDYVSSGLAYVPLETAMKMQRQMVEKDVKAIWDRYGEGLPEMTQYTCKAWSPILYPIPKYDEYGIPFPTVLPFDSTDEDTSTIWLIAALFTRHEDLWIFLTSWNRDSPIGMDGC